MKYIQLDIPIWNNIDYKAHISNRDINILINELPDNIDVIYLDPPYGSNYFILNIIANNEEPSEISNVSGIHIKWNKSIYNTHTNVVSAMKSLIETGLKNLNIY